MNNIFIGENNKAKKMKKGFVGIDNIARKINNIYIGNANGFAKLVWRSFLSKVTNIKEKKTINDLRVSDVAGIYFDTEDHFIASFKEPYPYDTSLNEYNFYSVYLNEDGSIKEKTYTSGIEHESSYNWNASCYGMSKLDDNKVIFLSSCNNSNSGTSVRNMNVNVYNSHTGNQICKTTYSYSDDVYKELFCLNDNVAMSCVCGVSSYTAFYVHKFNNSNNAMSTQEQVRYRQIPNGYSLVYVMAGAALLSDNRFVIVDIIKNNNDQKLYFLLSIFTYDTNYTFTFTTNSILENENSISLNSLIFSENDHILLKGYNSVIGFYVDKNNNCSKTNTLTNMNNNYSCRIGKTYCAILYSRYYNSKLIYYNFDNNSLIASDLTDFKYNGYSSSFPYGEDSLLDFNYNGMTKYVFG